MLALIIVGMIAVGLAVAVVLLTSQNARFKAQIGDAESTYVALRDARLELSSGRDQAGALQARLKEVEAEDQRKAEWLDHQEKELQWQGQELEKRPKITRKTYKVLTVGMSGTGKTALTLKWANPLVDLGTLQGTKIERYERTVSHVPGPGVTVEHTFEIGDWGGEHIVEAQHELLMEEVHGLLMVVDLAKKGTRTLDPERIQQQLSEFQPQALKFFFGPQTFASCKTLVLFINKSDVLAGTPEEVEREARSYYKKLIDDLDVFKSHIDVRVLVGSAQYGHSIHHLFAHFVERILPRDAYDNQLLQQMKGVTEPSGGHDGRTGGPVLAALPPMAAMARTQPLPPPLPRGLPGPAGPAPTQAAALSGRSTHAQRK